MFVALLIIFQIVLVKILVHNNFSVATTEMLQIFVPLVWTSVGTSALSIVYLCRRKRADEKLGKDSDALTTDRVIWLASYVMFCTITFVFLSLLFPARDFLNKLFGFTDLVLMKSLYDSLLLVTFAVPCLVAALIGAWLFVLEFAED